MSQTRNRDLDQEVLGPFKTSFNKRYQNWKNQDLIEIALQTMPEQAKKARIDENLDKLKTEFSKRLSEQ